MFETFFWKFTPLLKRFTKWRKRIFNIRLEDPTNQEDKYLALSMEEFQNLLANLQTRFEERKNESFPRLRNPSTWTPPGTRIEKDQESRLIDETVKDYALEIHSRRVNTYRLYETVDEAPTSFSDSEINPRSEAPLIVSFGARRVSREVGRSSSNGWIPPSPPYPESSRQRSVNNRGKR